MKKILLLFFLFLPCFVPAQTQKWNWAQNAAGTENSDGFSISSVVGNSVYVCGEFFGPTITFGNTVLSNAGPSGTNDIFIVKYDLSGNVIRAKSMGGAGNDFARSITADAAGNIYMAGGFSSAAITFGNIVLTNTNPKGTHDIYITKFDPSGEVIWAKNIGGMLDDRANCITTDKAGNVCVTGWFGSKTVVFGNDTLKNATEYGNVDVFTARLSSDGNVLWARSATGQSEDYGYGITTDSENSIYITGSSFSPELNFSGIKIANPGYEKMYIAKYAADGNLVFAQSTGGNNNAEGTSITADAADNICITGKFSSSSITMDTTTLTNAGAFDVYIAKYNAAGTILWATSAGGSEDDRGNNIIADKEGNIYITGWFASTKIVFGKTYLNNPGDKGSTHTFIAKYSSEGKALWSECAAGKNDDWGNGIAIDAAGDLYLTGGFDSAELNFSATKVSNAKGNDFYIGKLLKP